ncbi:MAG: hypothetical protein AM326_00325 [Candidatus Thorarchaeota archaeon SMTZ-45]|nr:MAG: hypothetical protein AM326_00325 [Candidatus Thorarchaeota archaeon SMTZ-45]
MFDIHELDSDIAHKKSSSWKKGVRVLGVSESFQREDVRSIAVGVVMRGDMRIDGIGFCEPKVGGTDATDLLIDMYSRLGREDIRGWILGGCIISWFNVIDSIRLNESTNVPVVCLSYRPSEGIEKFFREYFPDDWKDRVELMDKGGQREEVSLKTGHSVFLTTSGITIDQAKQLVDQFTLDGRIPEPIRIARIIAAARRRDQQI